ncbi:MAG: methyl-accepting chemotaxis protein [Gallionella sp.]|jgi:methyl-accepting chemotaxis protein|nr:methyl-accepting chemotaxis protein [Gallionella sp.]
MSLQAQLRLIAAITAMSLLGVILFSVVQLGTLRSEFSQYQARQTFAGNLAQIKSLALTASRSDPILAETETALATANDNIHSLLEGATAAVPAEIDGEQLKQIASTWDDYAKGFDGAIKIASTSPEDALQIPDALYQMHLEPMIANIDQLVALNRDGETQARENISGAVGNILWIIVLPLIAAAVIVIAFQAVFNSRLKKRIDGIVDIISHLSAGDLSHRLPEGTADEIGIMVRTINGFITRIGSVLHDVNVSADQSKLTAHKVNAMTQSVSSNAQTQSEKIFNVMSAIEKMGHTITEIAGNATHAADTAKITGEKINEVGIVGQQTSSLLQHLDATVESSAQTMKQFDATLQRIGSISNIIKGIAEQTNLLALNAAIEAARAGDHGRGFAVVADEVRLLSERTTASAKDISGLLNEVQQSSRDAISSMDDTRDSVRTGVEHGEKIGAILAEAEASIQNVAGMMQQIALATETQSREGRLISGHIADVTHITTSTTHEIETTRHEMAGLAKASEILQQMVSQFRLSGAKHMV